MAAFARFAMACRLGWQDIRHELLGFGCHVLALAAVLAPLLILYGLKSGVIENLTAELASDVRTLQVSVVSNDTFERTWIEEMAARPEVGFIQGHTRTLSTSVEIVRRRSDNPARMEIVRGTLLASGAGDPLLPDQIPPPDAGEIVLSAALAQQLGASAGGRVELALSRTFDGARQSQLLPLAVTGVVERSKWSARGALVHLSTLVDVERWRDGNAVPARGWTEGRSGGASKQTFPNLRLYAADLDSVEPVVRHLTGLGMEVRSRLAQVQAIQGLDHSLSWIFLVISGVAAAGAAVSFGATLWANVMRKAPAIGQIRLQGLERRAVIGFPLAQAFIVSITGTGVATLLAFGGCGVIDRAFGAGLRAGANVCTIGFTHVGAAAFGAVGLALLGSAAAAVLIARIEPSKGLGET